MVQLYDKLISYKKDDFYPMHMPGHKRNTRIMHMDNPYSIDITEIEGFDNLHQPEGVLKELAERISKLYGTVKSYPLVNGSTAGILAGISAATKRGDSILVARNCHKSVFHGIAIRGLKPIYCYPQIIKEFGINGGILAEDIEKALISNQNIKLVVITSPTYEGVVSDIREIAETVHRYGARLLVDEAHGAHFGFHPGFPYSSISRGADIIIQSLHKTLPSFTQTAVLHTNAEELDRKLEQYLSIYQSSSPSYLLMAGIDRCIHLLEREADQLFSDYYDKLEHFYHTVETCRNIKVLSRDVIGTYGIFDLDPSKITVSVRKTRLSGHRLQELLREKYRIIMEMEAPDYVLGMTSICDSEEGFDRLINALLNIDQETAQRKEENSISPELENKPVQILIPQDALEQPTELIELTKSSGRICASFIGLFPPGIPLLVPGERIEADLITYMKKVRQQGIMVTGLSGENNNKLEVVKQAHGNSFD